MLALISWDDYKTLSVKLWQLILVCAFGVMCVGGGSLVMSICVLTIGLCAQNKIAFADTVILSLLVGIHSNQSVLFIFIGAIGSLWHIVNRVKYIPFMPVMLISSILHYFLIY